MSKLKKKPPMDEVKVLFPEEQVGPYTIRPWSITQFGQVFGILTGMVNALAPLGLTFENAEVFLVQHWPEMIPAALPFFPQLILVTLRLPPPDVEKMDAGTQAALGLRIILQNRDSIKNFLTLVVGGLAGVGATSTADTPLH